MKHKILIILLFIGFFVNSQEQITSFASQSADQSSNPYGFFEFNNLLYFGTTHESYGKEIWMSNGTADNATLLKDIYHGNNDGINTFKPVVLNNEMYFIARDGKSNGELWKSDGTSQGTTKVTDFLNYNVLDLTLVGNHIFFMIKESDTSWKVWKSDGTAIGTTIVTEVPAWNSPTYQGELNNLFLFTVQTPSSNDSRVWRSDGTNSGSFPVMENADGNNGSSSFSNYIKFNNELYFIVRSSQIFGSKSVGIMKTDGSLENTTPVKGIHVGDQAGGYSGIITFGSEIVLNNKLYFSFFQKDFNRLFICETDGTQANTEIIFDVVKSTYFVPSNLNKKDNSLVFCSGNDVGGTQLVALDTDSSILTEIKELANNVDEPGTFRPVNSQSIIKQIDSNQFLITLPINSTTEGRKGWISDLTSNNTVNIPNLDGISSVYLYNSLMYFSKLSTLEGRELWKSDATKNGTFLIDNINKSKYGISKFTSVSVLNKKLIFNVDDGIIGDEMWTYNNDVSHLSLLKDINLGTSGSNPHNFTHYDDAIFLVANNSINGAELWKSDGTEVGTMIAHDINAGSGSSAPNLLVKHQNDLYFTAKSNLNTFLYKKTGENLVAIKDFGIRVSGSADFAQQLVSSGNYVYFSTWFPRSALWRCDGTEAGTVLLKEFRDIGKVIDVNGTLFFTAVSLENINEIELYKSNGTVEGTVLVKNIEPGFSSFPANLTNNNGILYFSAETSTNGRELWRSDGTDSGTFQVLDIYQGASSSINGYSDNYNSLTTLSNTSFSVLNGEIYFNATNGINGNEVWKSDGTESGTYMVLDINPGTDSSNPDKMVVIGNSIYFQAFDEVHGMELWKSNGSQQGTVLVADILPGALNSNPTHMHAIGNDLFFIGDTFDDGRQIWRLRDEIVLSTPTVNEESLSFYPNPSSNSVNIITKRAINNIQIYNLQGSLVKSINSIEGNNFNISDMSSGVYLVLLESKGYKTIKKLIIR